MFELLLGTSNPGKVRELTHLLAGLPLRVISLKEAGLDQVEVDEPFATFAENALHKARTYARLSRLAALADDSGLEIDALDGRPGVYSARYAPGDDAARMNKVLAEMKGVPDGRRTARFKCVAAVALPDGRSFTGVGTVEGRIAHVPGAGREGFGYDPIFIPEGHEVSFGDLPREVKNTFSHRGRALLALLPQLRALIDGN